MQVHNTNDIKPTKINALIQGPSGVGKTTLLGTLPPKTIIVSLEGGLLSLRGKSVDYVEVDPSRKTESLRELLGQIEKSDYDNVAIDSLTEISQAFYEYAKKEYPDDRNTMQRYGRVLELTTAFIKYTRDMNKNVFFTVLEKSEKDNIGRISHLPDLVGSASSKAIAFFDFVFVLKVYEKDGEKVRALLTNSEDGYQCKDRSGALDTYEKPDLAAIINKVFN